MKQRKVMRGRILKYISCCKYLFSSIFLVERMIELKCCIIYRRGREERRHNDERDRGKEIMMNIKNKNQKETGGKPKMQQELQINRIN